MGWNI